MFHQIFLSSEVKKLEIITYKHGIYEMPRELAKNLRLRILGNCERLRKSLNLIG